MDKDVDNYKFYEFLREGRNIYDVLSSYFPELKGDYSVPNLLNNLSSKDEKIYEDVLKNSSYILLLADNQYPEVLSKNRKVKNLTDDQKEQLIEKFRQALPDSEFTTITEYVTYAKDNINNPKTENLRKAIIDSSIEVADEEDMLDLKRTLLRGFLSKAIKESKTKNGNLSKIDDEEYSEIDKMEFLYDEILSDSTTFAKYEELLVEYKEKLKQEERKIFDEIRYSDLRDNSAKSIMEKAIPVYDKDVKDPISSLFCKDDSDLASKGGFNWKIKLYENPIVLCDGMANYSKNGSENQKVVAISYGKFLFDTGVIDDSIVQPDLIGVSRVGRDGIHNYFVLASLSRINLKRNSNFDKDEESKVDILVDGKKAELKDDYSGRTVHITVQLPKIPEELKEFFLKAFLSDSYLTRVIEENYRYAGSVSKSFDGEPVMASDGDFEVRAIRKALQTEGQVGTKKVKSLEDYCNSALLTASHLDMVRDIVNSSYYKDSKSENER